MDIAKDYPDKSVKIVPALVPDWPTVARQDRLGIQRSRATPSTSHMRDSQSTAEFAGHAVKLNDIFDKSSYLKADIFPPASLSRYGEYPDGSGEYYGLPANQDAYGLTYRKDLFEDPKEKEAFKAKYGKELAVPQTYQDAKEIAEFFTRPDQGLYGWGQMGGRDYDFATTASNSFLWSFGGELYNPTTMEVKGYLDSAGFGRRRAGLCRHVQVRPPGSGNWGFDEVNAAFQQGQLAMAMQWFYFNGSNADPKVTSSPTRPPSPCFRAPSAATEKFRRQFSVGGQGMGINKYSKKLPELTKFMEWYFLPDQQKRYAAVCQTGLKSVLESPDWQGLNSYNRQFSTALAYLNDYWHLPEYPALLDELQQEVSNAVSGSKTVQQALSGRRREERADAGARRLRDQAQREDPGSAGPGDFPGRPGQGRSGGVISTLPLAGKGVARAAGGEGVRLRAVLDVLFA